MFYINKIITARRIQFIKKIFLLMLISMIVVSYEIKPQNIPDELLMFLNEDFENISLEEGLSQSTIRCIEKDSKGFMWFGTADGLNRYDGYNFTVFRYLPNDPNSLSSAIIRDIHEDRNGILWIATEGGGLNKFNNVTESFFTYRNDPKDSNSLSNNYVWSIFEDSSGILWLGTTNGLNSFDPVTEKFIRFFHKPEDKNSLCNNNILCVTGDKQGKIWIGTNGGGLDMYDPSTGIFTNYNTNSRNSYYLSGNAVLAIYEDSHGILWIGTADGGLNKFDRDKNTFVHFRSNPAKPYSISDDRINTICEDRNGDIWVGTNGGGLNKLIYISKNLNPEEKALFKKFPFDTEVFIHFKNDPRLHNSLSNNNVWSLFDDGSGTLWIGTEFGGINKLDKYRNKFPHFKRIEFIENTLNDNSIWSIYVDSTETVWIGTRNGGLNKWDRTQNRFYYYTNIPGNPNSLSQNHVRAIFRDRTRNLWIGTDQAGLNKMIFTKDQNNPKFIRFRYDPDNRNSLNSNRVYSILQDKDGIFWFGTRTGGLDRYDESTGKFTHYLSIPGDSASLGDDFVYKVFEDSYGELWAGTFMGGLCKFNKKSGTFTRYQNDKNNPKSISSNCVLTIFEDHERNIWTGTGGGGISKFNRTDGTFTNFTEEDGLANNFVYGILEDEKGNLWISSNKGITRFSPSDNTFRNFDVYDGIQSNEFNGGAYFKSKNGEMFFGGINGINAFYPQMIKENPNTPPVYITGFKIFNKEVGIGENSPLKKQIIETGKIVLSYQQNMFSFEFASLDFTSPVKNKYKYILEGFQKEWVETDADNRIASYMNLPPGEYVFKVIGSNNDDLWNTKGASIGIIITPPFWANWWFRILMMLAVIAFGLVIYKRRTRIIRMKTELNAAHNAQMSIMPQVEPDIDNLDISGICIPANEVGGDFFDYFRINDDRFCVVVGDVSGKAMNSAMLAVMTSGMAFNLMSELNSVKDTMIRLNKSLFDKTEKNMFIVLCLALFDMNKNSLTFCNAGINKPLIKSGEKVSFVESAGPRLPLGGIKDTTYEEKTIELKQGDILLFYTDGVTETQNNSKKFFGDERLTNLLREIDTNKLSAKEIKEIIIAEIKKFSGKTVQFDDMTILVVKIK